MNRNLTNIPRKILSVALCLALLAPSAAPADTGAQGAGKYAKQVDESVDRALEYLVASQESNGAMKDASHGVTGITSLAVMAFLAKGYTPGQGKYGEVINKGIDFVLSQQQKNGLLLAGGKAQGAMYCHGISTLMLSEVSGMVDPARQERIDEALAKALKLILSAQEVRKAGPHQGGWRYQSNSRDSDISCTGWQLMALRSARSNGAQVPKEAIDNALEFIMNCRHEASGGFCYQPTQQGPGLGRTGTALLCLALAGRHDQKPAIGAGEFILRSITKGDRKIIQDGQFPYAVYYCSQGMFQLGGKYWDHWAEAMYPTLLGTQKNDGSWADRYGSTYGTSMAVLAMSVIYRQLPIYQR
mgnify:CR=1 FL=1